MGKLILLASILSFCGCAQLPEFPEISRCAFVNSAFYCVNTKTEARTKLPADHPSMNKAQCVSLADWEKSENWIDEVVEIAKTRCQ